MLMVRGIGIGMEERNYKQIDTAKRKKKLAKLVERGGWRLNRVSSSGGSEQRRRQSSRGGANGAQLLLRKSPSTEARRDGGHWGSSCTLPKLPVVQWWREAAAGIMSRYCH